METTNYANFFNKENRKIKISFEFLPMNNKIIETTIRHPKIDDIVRFPVLIDGPEKVCWDNGFWMEFDTDEELIGLVEYQANVFEEWIFDFLSEKRFVNVFEVLNAQRRKNIESYVTMNQEERFRVMDIAREYSREICKRRYLPKKWTIA